MRIVQNLQMQVGEVDISSIKLDLKSRDDIPTILRGLQHLYMQLPICHGAQCQWQTNTPHIFRDNVAPANWQFYLIQGTYPKGTVLSNRETLHNTCPSGWVYIKKQHLGGIFPVQYN